MQDKNEADYTRCFTCGKYIIKTETYKNRFCSLACSTEFSRCITCGSFYMSKKGYSEKYCTENCSIE